MSMIVYLEQSKQPEVCVQHYYEWMALGLFRPWAAIRYACLWAATKTLVWTISILVIGVNIINHYFNFLIIIISTVKRPVCWVIYSTSKHWTSTSLPPSLMIQWDRYSCSSLRKGVFIKFITSRHQGYCIDYERYHGQLNLSCSVPG